MLLASWFACARAGIRIGLAFASVLIVAMIAAARRVEVCGCGSALQTGVDVLFKKMFGSQE